MAKRAKQRAVAKDKKLKKMVFLVSCAVLAAKLILIISVKHGGWLGADGESYLKGVDAILKDGLASKNSVLVYWPAGYPILLWLLSLVTLSKMIYLVSIFQTIVYFLASAFFAEQVRRTRLSKLALPLALILGLNPTLSLSSLTIGYESLVASCMMASVALIIRYELNQKSKANLIQTSLLVGLLQSFSAFMQPRELLLGFFILFFWGIFHKSWETLTAIVLLGTCAMMILPAAIVMRNVAAKNGSVISKNLGVNMSLGAGDKATGGYGNSGGVPCSPNPASSKVTDSQLITCTISWHLHHPSKTATLAVRKSIYFWSPWSGPLANGTMARNPWLKIDPIRNIISNKQGYDLVYGWIGKVISWVWLLSGLLLFFIGFSWLWRMGGVERRISVLVAVPVLLAWMTAIGTFGDHRFRLPTMGLSLFLQVAGYFGLMERFAGGARRTILEPRGRAR
jgi:hypothetical protein